MKRRNDAVSTVRPEMNVTPLVDVVLVLLIVFMVVAPHLQYDVPVDLPGVVNPDPASAAGNNALQVTITAGGDIYIAGQRRARDEVLSVLQAFHVGDPLRRLAIRADERLSYGDVRALCADAQHVGFPGVALMVGEHQEGWADEAS